MADTPEFDQNDQALVDYFLRGMRRFAKHVRAQDIFEKADTETIQTYIETAYCLACMRFAAKEISHD